MQILADPKIGIGVRWLEIQLLMEVRWRQNVLNKTDGDVISNFVVVEPGDSVATIEKGICDCIRNIPGMSELHVDESFSPSFNWIVSHVSCYEVAFIHGDFDYGVCLLIPRDRNIDPDLLALGECSGLSVPEVIKLDVVYQTAQ